MTVQSPSDKCRNISEVVGEETTILITSAFLVLKLFILTLCQNFTTLNASTRHYALSVHSSPESAFDYRLPFDTGESEGAHNVGHAHFDPIYILRNAKITNKADTLSYYQRYFTD